MINKILKGTGAVFSNSILTSILAILLVPLILSSVGQEKYGLIVLAIFLSVRNGVLTVFTFGVQSAVPKFVAEYHAEGFLPRMNSLLGAAFLFYTVSSLSVVAILFATKRWLILDVFNVPLLLADEYLAALNYVFLSIFLQFYSLLFQSYLEGLNKFFISKVIDTLAYIAYFLTVIWAIHIDAGYIVIIKLWASMHAVSSFLCLLALRFIESPPALSFSFEKPVVATWLKYCFALFTNSIASLIYNHAPKFLVTTLISTSALAIYDIISKIPASAKSFVGLGNKVIVPTASELLAKQGERANEKLFTVGLKLNLLVFAPFITALALLSEYIIYFWVGEDYVQHTGLMQILFLMPLLSIFMSHGFAILLGSNNKVSLFALFGWSILIVSCLYWAFALVNNGLVALVVGRVLGLVVMVPVALYVFLTHFKVNHLVFIRQTSLLLVLALVPLSLKMLIAPHLNEALLIQLLLLSLILYFSYIIAIYFIALDVVEKYYMNRIAHNMIGVLQRKFSG